VPIVIGVIAILLPDLVSSAYWIQQIQLVLIYTMVVGGLNLSFGFAGEVQFGQVMSFAIGAYIAGASSVRGHNEIVLLLVIGGVAAALVGTLISVPALRIGGWSLAMTSFFLVIAIPDLTDIFSTYTGGDEGLSISAPAFFGTTLGTAGLYRVTAVTAVVWMVLYRNFVTSRYGVIFRHLRESPVLASSLGFSVLRLKALAYGLGAFPAGAAGCLFVFAVEYVDPSTFGLALAIGFVAASVLGGVESVYGAVVGAAIFVFGPSASLSFQQYAPVVYGAFLILAVTIFPLGLSGLGRSLALRLATFIAPSAHALSGASLRSMTSSLADQRSATSVVRSPAVAGLEPTAGFHLVVEGVSKSFGGVRAVRNVSLTAKPGQITALIGSNGSGKTTMLNLISGYVTPDTGTITLDGKVISGETPQVVARMGVRRTFQTPSVPKGLSVMDAVASGRYCDDPVGAVASMFRLPRYRQARNNDRREAMRALQVVGLSYLAEREAATLPQGTRRLLEVARALCGGTKLMLLDEPASGLSEAEVETLARALRAAADVGTAVVLIEHNFGFVISISDVVHVMHIGELIASGDGSSIARDPRVVESYLGSLSGDSVRTHPTSPSPDAQSQNDE
jgi:branched-chain amino acid transport system ATP-binding protein/branched-chain amino acid transport system permease protein